METPTEEPEPVTYALPGAPPTGRRVKSSTTGETFLRVPTERNENWEAWFSGAWIALGKPEGPAKLSGAIRYSWPVLLAMKGPLILDPLTATELTEEHLYGPVGQRWGDPNICCPYKRCSYGVGHVGVHRDEHGAALGLEHRIDEEIHAGPDFCTCGTPARHQPGCPRRDRISGEEK